MIRICLIASFVLLAACSRESHPGDGVAAIQAASVSAAPAATPVASTPAVSALRTEIVPVIGGLFPVSKADPAGTPVSTTLVLRVHNDSDAPVVLRTGGDDEGFEVVARGPGVVSTKSTAECKEIWKFGLKQTIAPRGHLDVPLHTLRSGVRCHETAHYLTAPGLYELEVTLRAHVHASDAPPAKGERGTEVLLAAPKITLRAG